MGLTGSLVSANYPQELRRHGGHLDRIHQLDAICHRPERPCPLKGMMGFSTQDEPQEEKKSDSTLGV